MIKTIYQNNQKIMRIIKLPSSVPKIKIKCVLQNRRKDFFIRKFNNSVLKSLILPFIYVEAEWTFQKLRALWSR